MVNFQEFPTSRDIPPTKEREHYRHSHAPRLKGPIRNFLHQPISVEALLLSRMFSSYHLYHNRNIGRRGPPTLFLQITGFIIPTPILTPVICKNRLGGPR